MAHRVPFPPNKGDKIRSFYELKHLTHGHEVHLLAFYEDPRDGGHASTLRQYCHDVKLIPLQPWLQTGRALVKLVAGRPWSLGYFSHGAMWKAVQEKLQSNSFDVVFVYSSSMAPYIEQVQIPRILDFVDSDASKWGQYAERRKLPLSWLFGLEARRLGRYEKQMADVFDYSLFVSEREAAHLVSSLTSGRIKIVRNGVDLDFFTPRAPRSEAPLIVFTGAMDYFPNVDAVGFFSAEVLPLIRKYVSDARFQIVGSDPSRAVRRLAQMPGVSVVGRVPDTRPYLADARVAVAPLRISQGIQNKILEALAMGVPVVASEKAAGGLADLENLPLSIAGKVEDYVDQTVGWLKRPRLTWSEILACRTRLKENYDWQTNLGELDRLWPQIGHDKLREDADNCRSDSGLHGTARMCRESDGNVVD
ncbi:MAG: TIGR03087 family PEP-CTERM/XrtA system glycosyltransferase [Acidobacteriota bacterium]